MNDVQTKKKAVSVSLKVLAIMALFIIAVSGFGLIAHEMVVEKENNFDLWVFALLKPFSNPQVTAVMTAITFFGSAYFLLPAYIVIVLAYLIKRRSHEALNFAAIGIGSTLMMHGLKTFYERVRPDDPLITNVIGYSFPSGHSFSSFTFYSLVIVIIVQSKMNALWKWLLSALCIVTAVLVAFSRVYLHVHFASDVIGGCLLAVIWLLASFAVLKKIDRKQRNQPG